MSIITLFQARRSCEFRVDNTDKWKRWSLVFYEEILYTEFS